ncbi:MAG: LysM peptidoglycan-binding domain-containing protein [Planctomycetota bacterium]
MAFSFTRTYFVALALTAAVAGCKPVNSIYEQDTGDITAVPGPPPTTIAPAPGYTSEASGDEVAFIEPGTQDMPSTNETEAIEPLPEPEPVVEVRTYTVQKGDNYWKIAESVYGDPMKMKDIEAANPGIDPKKLKIGDQIVLP